MASRSAWTASAAPLLPYQQQSKVVWAYSFSFAKQNLPERNAPGAQLSRALMSPLKWYHSIVAPQFVVEVDHEEGSISCQTCISL